jgi:flagellar biosynthesis chaperone FliJ
MNLKQMTFFLIPFLFLSTAVSAQQATKADIQVLEAKIASLDTKITEMDKRLTDRIDNLDKRLTAQIQAVQTTMVEMDNRLTSRIDTLFWAIGALIGIILTVVALPQLLGYFQEKRARAEFEKKMEADFQTQQVNFQQQIEALKKRLEQQQQEIEELKSRRILTGS